MARLVIRRGKSGPGWLTRVGRYFGRRGGVLGLFGIAWLFIGVSFATVTVQRFTEPADDGSVSFLALMDSRPWPGLLWVACGIIAVGNALVRRKVRDEDAIGYAALIIPPMLWTFTYGWSFIVRLMSGYPPARHDGYLGSIVYAVVVVAILTISRWPDDLDLPPPAVVSGELALLDRLVETKQENADRGSAARIASEEWIGHARSESERRIAESAVENDRLIALEKELHPDDPGA